MITLDRCFVCTCIRLKQWNDLTNYLSSQFAITVDRNTNRPCSLSVSEQSIIVLEELLSTFVNETEMILPQITVLTEIYRSLRNCCIKNYIMQETIINGDYNIVRYTKFILMHLIQSNQDTTETCVKMTLQFLTNAVIDNETNVRIVWNALVDVIMQTFKIEQFLYPTSAFIYNCLLISPENIPTCYPIYETIIVNCEKTSGPNDYFLFLLDIFAQSPHFYEKYETFSPNNRLTLLSFLMDKPLALQDVKFIFPVTAIPIITQQFLKKSDCVLKTVPNYVDQIEPREVVLMLHVLATLCAKPDYQCVLQSNMSLLINSAFLLQGMHSLGKASENKFTPIQSLSAVTSSDSTLSDEPTYGMKANLIRLLGNMCWKNKENQDTLRELDMIPLLLDCCNIDARNPFIIQCTVLTIRNMCEKNPENQAVIAGLTRQGVVNSSILQEMGLKLHDDATNSISIVPLDSIRK